METLNPNVIGNVTRLLTKIASRAKEIAEEIKILEERWKVNNEYLNSGRYMKLKAQEELLIELSNELK